MKTVKPMFTFMVEKLTRLNYSKKRIFFPKKKVVIDYPDTFQQRLKNTIYTPEMIKKMVFCFLFGTL
jgi:hypothetical protein